MFPLSAACLFELEDLGARELKGSAAPVQVWAALHARSVESRFEALHASDLTTHVGREEETEVMLRRWSRRKSRLTAALLEHLVREPHTRLRYFCSPQHTDSALHPIIGQLERAAGLAHDDAPQTRLDKLSTALAQASTSPRDAARRRISPINPGAARPAIIDVSVRTAGWDT